MHIVEKNSSNNGRVEDDQTKWYQKERMLQKNIVTQWLSNCQKLHPESAVMLNKDWVTNIDHKHKGFWASAKGYLGSTTPYGKYIS